MRTSWAGLLGVVCAVGCGHRDDNKDGIADGVRDPNNVSLVAPSTPVGTLSGTVLTTKLLPLAEAQVSLNVGGRVGDADAPIKTTTDTEGNFAFSGVPGGSRAGVTITKAGHATLRASANIPAAAGNFPINNGNAFVGPFTLTQLDGTLKILVVTRSGKPAKGVKATVEATPAGTLVTGDPGNYGPGIGLVVAEATADDAGLLTFSQVPATGELARLNGYYDLLVGALDENGDGIPEFAGASIRYTGRSLLFNPSTPVLTLPDARAAGGLSVVASNVESMLVNGSQPPKNMIRPSEGLFFVFNQPVLESSLVAKVTDETGTVTVATSKTLKNGTLLTVQPATALEVGHEYNLSVRATSLDNGSTFSRPAYFFGGDPGAPKPFALATVLYRDAPPLNNILNSGERVIFIFNQPIRLLGSGPAEASVDSDFNASGTKGDVRGELGFASGFPIAANEPQAEPNTQFVLQLSGYTTRYEFTLSGATVGVSNTTSIQIAFSRLLNAAGGYQTVWGTPVTADEARGVTIAP